MEKVLNGNSAQHSVAPIGSELETSSDESPILSQCHAASYNRHDETELNGKRIPILVQLKLHQPTAMGVRVVTTWKRESQAYAAGTVPWKVGHFDQ